MLYRRKYAKKYAPRRRPVYRRRSAYRPRPVKNHYYPVGISKVMRVKLRYQEILTNTLDSVTPNTNTRWALNDLYDPNFSGVGTQAMMRDEWYNLYQYARCVAVQIRMRFITDSDSPVHVVAGFLPGSGAVSYGNFAETKGAKKTIVTKNKPAVLTFSGLVDRILSNARYTALTDDLFRQSSASALDAAAVTWFHVNYYFSNLSGSSNVTTQYEITQIVQFSEPFLQSGS